ncbi:MAG: hypothetical protein ABF463_00015 [Ethanoligenens sp.]
METIINGIRCRSHVYSISTGETKDFRPDMCHDVLKSYLSRCSEEEIHAFPVASRDSEKSVTVVIKQGCVVEVRDIESKTAI